MGWLDDAGRRLGELCDATVAAYDRDAALVARGYANVREHGVEWANERLRETDDVVIGDDIHPLVDRKKSLAKKGLAALSIASDFIGPEGKLGLKAGELGLEEIAEHGGEKLLAAGLKQLETQGEREAMYELAKAGIAVADTALKLTSEQLAAKMPGGTRILDGIRPAGTLNPAADPESILHAVVDATKVRDGATAAREAIEGALADFSPATLERFRNSGPAEVGIPHLQVKPYDGTTRSGSVTFVKKEQVEQYAGGGDWRSYDLTHDLKDRKKALEADEFGARAAALPTKIEAGECPEVTAGGRVTLTPRDRSQDVLDRGRAQDHSQQHALAGAPLGGARWA